MCRPINQYAAVITALTKPLADRRAASPVEGTGFFMPLEPYPGEGKRQRSTEFRHLTRFSRYSSTTSPVMASR